MRIKNLFRPLSLKNDGRLELVFINEVIAKVHEINPHITPELIEDKHWLDAESLYEQQGWKVKYDQPGYCEEYEPYFEFSKAKGNKNHEPMQPNYPI